FSCVQKARSSRSNFQRERAAGRAADRAGAAVEQEPRCTPGAAGAPARPARSQSPAAKPASSGQDGQGDPLWKGQSVSSDLSLKEPACVLPLELRGRGIRERYAHEGGCAGTWHV
ncbi:unnamed protein product, partial [Coccothraustes coccothraustes]